MQSSQMYALIGLSMLFEISFFASSLVFPQNEHRGFSLDCSARSFTSLHHLNISCPFVVAFDQC